LLQKQVKILFIFYKIFLIDLGSGKTLAYLLPILSQVKMEEKCQAIQKKEKEFIVGQSSPKAIILVPSRELCFQVLKVVKLLGQYVRLKCETLVPGSSDTKQLRTLSESCDILITVPSLFLHYSAKEKLLLSGLRFLVMDEADSLFDTEFREEIKQFLQKIQIENMKKIVAVTATVTKPVKRFLEETFPTMVKVITRNVHKPAHQVQQRFIKIGPGFRAREKLCTQLVKLDANGKLMIFCNTKKGAEVLHGYMKQEIPGILCIHGDIKAESRTRIMKEFEGAERGAIICTDIASRGIDIVSV
jgi:ATP-dependent RNA helicase DDX28